MKIKIQDFGPIHYFEFDSDKDIHLIYGENSIGKSYAMNIVYSVLRSFINEKRYFNVYDYKFNVQHYTNEENNLHIKNFIVHKISNVFLPSFQTTMRKIFPNQITYKNNYSKEKYKIIIQTEDIYFEIVESPYEEFEINNFETNIDFALIFVNNISGNNIFNLIFNSTKKENLFERDLDDSFCNLFDEFINKNLSFLNQDKVFFLPASRSGLYELLKFSLQHDVKIFDDFSEPIQDYLSILQNVIQNQKIEKNIFLLEESQKIENELIKGQIKLDQPQKDFNYHNNNNMILKINQISSMQFELSLLVAYLKYVIPDGSENVKSTIFIEEPEVHLHPKIQVELIKFFVELTKKNIKIVMTSHSNYMFNKLNNMILNQDISPEKIFISHLVMTEKGSVDKKDMQPSEMGIEDNNFFDVAEELLEERENIIKKYNQKQFIK